MRKKTTKKRTTKAAAVKEETVTTAAKYTTKEAALVKETVKKATATKTATKKETPVKETATKVETVTEAEPKKATAKKTTTTKKTTVKKTAPAKETTKKTTAVKAETKKVEPVKETATKVEVVKEATPEKETAKKTTAKKAAPKKTTAKKTTVSKTEAVKEEAPVKEAAAKVETVKEAEPKKETAKKTATKKATTKKTTAKKATAKTEAVKEEAPKKTTKKATAKKTTKKATAAKKEAPVKEEPKVEETVAPEVEKKVEVEPEVVVQETPAPAPVDLGPRRSVAFIGSECYPFVKTGGLGDVMSALPKSLAKLNCDVKVIIPRYKCIPQKFQEKMEYKGSFSMDLCADGKQYYVGIMEYQEDGVVYDFIDNDEFFSWGNPYTNLIDDIPKFCYFGKAALAALNYLDWTPDVVHCHDWQAALVPLYLRTCFKDSNVGRASCVLTIHNLRFQGIYDRKTIQYWSGLPDYVFNKDCLTQNWLDANMLKGGITYSNVVTTVSNTYAGEIQTEEYGEGLEEHLRYHHNKLVGIVNGIDTDIWNPATDKLLAAPYDSQNVIENKKANKKALQESLGLEVDDHKIVIGLISRLTNQKGLDLVNSVIPHIMDEHTQVVVLGTGDAEYEDAFRYYENAYKGNFCAYIAYNENVAHNIYAGCDALLVPSRFEPCGLTQLISMRYGSVPIVRETGGLKDTVQPYNLFDNTGNGFTFDRYESGLLYDAINRAKTLYFESRPYWDDMVVRNMNKDVSWEQSAKHYKDMYVGLTPKY
ncbi:glycogen synthase [Catenibacterium sp.]|uniref:glycogen synthase n=1 Tax=Catenibacterium sp. TaxID=2049022 RepID=UPI002E760D86|nr:glycogen/starch synthase [Catenibacterium sp.]MEE0041348.1 glycogen/starch synthase [Catenibacterium sp.]